MKAQKFELFMVCLGNGTTVCNKAVMEHGDFKMVAHIQPFGKIKLYVPVDYIPSDAMEKIKETADRDRRDYIKRWNSLPVWQRYEKVMDRLPLTNFLEIVGNNGMTIEEKVNKAEKILYDLY